MVDGSHGAERRTVTLRRLLGGTVAIAAVTIVGSVALANHVAPPPSPPSRLMLEAANAAPIERVIPDVGVGKASGMGVVRTSDRFQPRITFKLGAPGTPGGAEFCVSDSSDRAIVLGHIMGCVDDVRIVRPAFVDCGIHEHAPSAASVAAAILAKPGIGAEDRGGLVDGGVPVSLFAGTPTIRVLHVPGTVRAFDASVDDPDDCVLGMTLDTGDGAKATDGDDAIEVRGDMAARYILLDVHGALVVIRAGVGGHDAESGAAARARGYGGLGEQQDKETIWHMLQEIYEIRFVWPG